MKIKLGDTVEALDDAIKGKVTKIEGQTITFLDDNGFDFQLLEHELIVINPNANINLGAFSNKDISKIVADKNSSAKRKQTPVKTKKRHQPTFVVDLHIHQLTDSTKGMSNFSMLNLQIDTAQRQLDFAIKQRMPKMVFIHGIGEGVLKQELHTVLRRYNNVTFYDADYKTYGLGATEVKIFQNI